MPADATQASVTLPESLKFADFKLCPNCYSSQIQIPSLSSYVDALQTNVIDPVMMVQKLIDAHPQVTRLYTTMSARDMTVDPLFTFNADLADVSNLHTAKRFIECNENTLQTEAPWRIELPQGGVVRGTAAQVGTWPTDLNTLPPSQRILQAGKSGAGKVLEDNASVTSSGLSAYNAKVTGAPGGANGGCSVASGRTHFGLFLGLGAFAALGLRRRRVAKALV